MDIVEQESILDSLEELTDSFDNSSLVTIHEDTADHLLKCSKLTNLRLNTGNINQIYANIVEQEEIAQALSRLMRQRTTILEMQEKTDLSN